MAAAISSEERDLEKLEEEFVQRFLDYLMTLSNVTANFEAGGQPSADCCILRKALDTVPSIVGAFGGNYGRPLKEVLQIFYSKLDRPKIKKLYRVLPQDKKIARKIYVDAAVKIFRMFEYQFSNLFAGCDENGRRAMVKFTKDAVERIINYIINKFDDIIKNEFHKSKDFIFNAILLGKSSRKFLQKGKTVKLKNANGELKKMNTCDLFETSGYVIYEKGTIFHQELRIGSGADSYGYKKLWPFDEFYKIRKSNKSWKTVERISMQYEYKLTFDEEDVGRRVQEIVTKLESTEKSTKADVENCHLTVVETMKQLLGIIQNSDIGGRNDLRRKLPKWWPDKKILIESLYRRKHGDKFLTEEIHDKFSKITNKNRMIVICESAAASQYSGMGGVGKTLTAKWYANDYEEEYDHIIWVDCGEGSFLHSFESMARDLQLQHLQKLNLKQTVTKSFQELSKFKCLWIYDNAENYKGEGGIIDILPWSQKNFYCLITSRSREWGTEKIGFGKIPTLEIDVFSKEESIGFLKEVLNIENPADYLLKELCHLLGYLPLALQLSVAILNSGKIDLKSYIEKNKFEKVIDVKFDDYERTINSNVKISLELILQEICGKEAHQILLVFGYIQPDDVEVEFFEQILNIEDERKMKGAIKILMKYSLVAKKKLYIADQIITVLSVHRLLQQVIRHNGRNAEKEILTKILGCEGFIDYKLLPFTKYADEKLQDEFPKVKAEFLNQYQLKLLLKEERFEEAVELAKFIYQKLETNTAKFNLAICLHKNRDEEKCLKILKELCPNEYKGSVNNEVSRTLKKMMEYIKTTDELRINIKKGFELADSKTKPTEKEILNHLFFSYLQLGMLNEASIIGLEIANGNHIIEILREMLQNGRFHDSVQLAEIITQELNTNTAKFNYAVCLTKNGQLEYSVSILEQLKNQEGIDKDLQYYSRYDVGKEMLNLEQEISRDLIYGHLLVVHWRIGNMKRVEDLIKERKQFQIIYSNDTLDILIQIVHSNLIHFNYSLIKGPCNSTTTLKFGADTNKIELTECSLDLSSFGRLFPEHLSLRDVSLSKDGESEEGTVNKFLDFDKINRLTLEGGYEKPMSIDLTGDVSLEYLYLQDIEVLAWTETKWTIERLELYGIPFEEMTKISTKEIKIVESSIDISCLPPKTEKLHLHGAEVFCRGEIYLPNLIYLKLELMDDISSLSFFRFVNLTRINFYWIEEINVDLLPESVTQIKITNYDTIVVGGLRRMEKIILEGFSLPKIEKLLSHFQTYNVVVDYYNGITPKEVVTLGGKEIKTVAVGKIKWVKQEVWLLSSLFDFYLWEKGKWRGILEEEFKELGKLF